MCITAYYQMAVMSTPKEAETGYIEKYIESLGVILTIREISFDHWSAVHMVQNLEGTGFTVVPFG